jgi:hypothetical protein
MNPVDEGVGDCVDARTGRVSAVGGHAGDAVTLHDHLTVQHTPIYRDDVSFQHLFCRIAPAHHGCRGECGARGAQDGRQRDGDREESHGCPLGCGAYAGLNAFGMVTVIVTRFNLSSVPVLRAQSAFPHIHAGLPAGRSSWGMSGSSADRKAEP